MNSLIIYHKNCCDGAFAAAVALRTLEDRDHFVTCRPWQYNDPLPTTKDLNGVHEIYIVDFSFQGDDLKDLVSYCQRNEIRLTIIDHHATAEKDIKSLNNFDGVEVVFNLHHSGAMLTWLHFNGDGNIPSAIVYAQDRDLWKFEYGDSKPFHAYCTSLPANDEKDIKAYWVPMLDDDLTDQLVKKGLAIRSYHERVIDARVNSFLQKPKNVRILGMEIPTINNTDSHIASDLIGALAESSGFGVACGYFDTPTHRVFSLRSRGTIDVSLIAKRLGGGGHKNAAGFAIDLARVDPQMDHEMFSKWEHDLTVD